MLRSDGKPSPNVGDSRIDPVEEAALESFPASDPPAWTLAPPEPTQASKVHPRAAASPRRSAAAETAGGSIAYRDLLLQLNSYPEPTPAWAIEAAASLAETFDARLSAAVLRIHIPDISNLVAESLLDVNEALAAENEKSSANGERLLSAFEATVAPGRRGEHFVLDCGPLPSARVLAELARTFDLAIVAADEHSGGRALAAELALDAGRPVLLLPGEKAARRHFDKVVIGWDGGRAAARALADALPICSRAKSVRLVTIAGEKLSPHDTLAGAARHLLAHGIRAETVEVTADGADAGSALLRFCREANADLLVMGAYGHSRLREFILGGATETVLAEADLPVLLSH